MGQDLKINSLYNFVILRSTCPYSSNLARRTILAVPVRGGVTQ